ncbi:MAG: VWA domain-containing protein [Acidobacteria bacterium]|nr:VWA domain-containing protein [Acidobacteriota bacterium]
MFNRLPCRAFSATALLTASLAIGLQGQDPPSQPPPSPQQPPVTFKVEVNYVEVDAVVTDAQGTFVRTLGKDDFQVLEDGRTQTISAFALVDIPVERVERPMFRPAAVEPDVKSNTREFDGRVYLLLLDDLHTHVMRSQRVKIAARQFIERHLGANDIAAVVFTGGRTDAGQEFTGNRQLLLAAVDRFMGQKVRSSTLERMEEAERQRGLRQPGERVDDPLDAERGFQARNTLETVKSVAEYMAGIRGRRKAVVFISEGIDYDIYDVFNSRYASTIMDDARDAIAAATRANVSIYSVDPRGLTQLGDESIEIASLPDDQSLRLGPGSMQEELRRAQDSLRVLADETGGFASVNANDFRAAFDRIVSENSSYYLLGYYPANERRDGRFRKIQVRVAKPGLQVRARKGYAAPRGKAPAAPTAATAAGTSQPLREALLNPLPVTGLDLSVSAIPFKGAAPNDSVAIAIQTGGPKLKFTEKDGILLDDLEVSLMAVDAQGKVRGGDRQSIQMKLKPETHAAVARRGFRLLSRVELPPGKYQLRVAGRESGGGLVGSVHFDLIVPDFSKEKLMMSGIALTSASARGIPTARPDEQLKEVLPGPPTTDRVFSEKDDLALFVDVYDNDTSAPHKVDITSTVTSDEGKIVHKIEEQRDSSELQGTRGGYGFTDRIQLKDFAPGTYVLKVEGRSRLGRGASASREIQFRIVQDPEGQE